MGATVTLASTTLGQACTDRDTRINLASTSGVYPGLCLFVDGELMMVQAGNAVSPWVDVKRGVGGSPAAPHVSATTVYIGRADQFYLTDPVGRPHSVIPISPYINTANGSVWFAQGDALPTGSSNRWWQRQTTTPGTTSLGVRTSTQDPTSST